MSCTIPNKNFIIMKLRKLFSLHALPEFLVSGKGKKFTSRGFQEFLSTHSIRHGHLPTNGQAENYAKVYYC